MKVGDTLEVGQVLCIVEAMKLMNEIECDVAGELVRKLVTNGQPIEYGQELFTVRPKISSQSDTSSRALSNERYKRGTLGRSSNV